MKTLVAASFVTAVATAGLVAVSAPVYSAVPCEDMLKEMLTAKADAKLSDTDMQKVDELEAKAVERCNADDDTRSDKFIAEAMKAMGK